MAAYAGAGARRPTEGPPADVEMPAETEGLLESQEQATGSRRRSAAVAALLVSAALATTAGALVLYGARGRAAEAEVAQAVSEVGEDMLVRTGCANWEDVFLAKHEDATLDECRAKCKDLPGCVQYNYQPATCGTARGLTSSSCYLFGDGCDQNRNPCWDLYKPWVSTPAASPLNVTQSAYNLASNVPPGAATVRRAADRKSLPA